MIWSTSHCSTNFAVSVQPKNVNPCVVVVARPLLVAMQYNEVVFRNSPFEVDALTRILLCHSRRKQKSTRATAKSPVPPKTTTFDSVGAPRFENCDAMGTSVV